ncbi:hypothetical protein LCGC14_0687780 [marine sediment metagenome]|uniref:Uncharacterized protein n=1 Tax=marine sediment metagenome TaxID=412755 RepID=A0A0F9R6N6_9ZZZZ
MKDEKLKEFKEDLENWLNFNKKRQPLDLLDISELLTIFRQYFIVKLKKSRENKKKK